MNKTIKGTSVIIILLLLNIIVVKANSQEITLAYVNDPKVDIYGKWGELIYRDAFARLNIDFSYIILPMIRASRMADLGRIDGEMGRYEGYGAAHPNLVRINEPISVFNISAYAYNSSIKIDSWQDIKNSQYKIEYYRGSQFMHERLTQYVNSDRLSDSSSRSESLRKLIRGRIDIYIETNEVVNELLSTPEFINVNIQMLTQLETHPVYGYLHQRHNDLALKLADIFRQMKVEGKFDAYLIQAKQLIGTQKINK
ncbi:hypothetical protein HQQ94_17105 [Shewanella sp. VB17]|uniref:hypothetical protein n=1 Tax=Shewanella sp. VB17 TaxID=2739432 RepID=UPI0015645EBF|nr:hypothetical protein [Shewanella sp. VB17]NRD74902.1 hypothetical protein [Shewanella sp. VB17]